jgi:hypothetical protein
VKEPFVNMEETIDRFVGRRKTPDGFQAGMGLQSLAVELHTSFHHRWMKKGGYRFKTHGRRTACRFRLHRPNCSGG